MARPKINWAQGMFRLWLVLSVIWILGMAIALRPDRSFHEYLQYQSMISENSETTSRFSRFADDKQRLALERAYERAMKEVQERMQRKRAEVAVSAALMFIPSFVLLALGAALYWIVIGFKREAS